MSINDLTIQVNCTFIMSRTICSQPSHLKYDEANYKKKHIISTPIPLAVFVGCVLSRMSKIVGPIYRRLSD